MDDTMPPKTMSKAYDSKMDALARIHGHIGKLIVGHKEHRQAAESHGGKHPSQKPIPDDKAPALDAEPSAEAQEPDEQETPFVNPLDRMMKPAKRGGARHGYLAPHQAPPQKAGK
jgi:hypothetical protein